MANNETTVKIKYEPDTSSLSSAATQASKIIEQSISKAKPNVNVDVSTKSVDKASEAVDKLYDRFRSLPSATKALENQMGKSFDNIAKLQDKALSGSLNNKNFEKMVNQNLNYVDKMLKSAEKKFSGTDFFGENSRQKMERYLKSGIIKGPKVEINEIDTTGIEKNIQSIFGNLGNLAGLAFATKFTKKMLSGISKTGGDIQDLQFGLQGFFGIENGVAAMKEFRELAKELPGDMNDAVEGFISLKNRGIEPTRQEFKDLVTFANSQGKNIDNLSMALSMAQTENYMRLRAYGVTIEKTGNKLIASIAL